jgi:hypothetical protein
VTAAYVIKNNREVGFKLGDYDRARTLVIDPIIDYSTYLGGGGQEEGNDIAVDANGYLYVTGWTTSVNFPMEHAIQDTLTGPIDAFVSIIHPAMGGSSARLLPRSARHDSLEQFRRSNEEYEQVALFGCLLLVFPIEKRSEAWDFRASDSTSRTQPPTGLHE